MSAPVLDETVLAFVRDVGQFVEVTPDGDGLEIGETQVQHVVRLVDGVYTVEMIERGTSNGLDVITEERGVVERYLVAIHGNEWRRAHGLERLFTARGEPKYPPGYEVIDEGDSFTVRWSQDGRECRASNLMEAAELVRTLPFTLDEVIASFKDRKGRPVFAAPAKRFWRR